MGKKMGNCSEKNGDSKNITMTACREDFEECRSEGETLFQVYLAYFATNSPSSVSPCSIRVINKNLTNYGVGVDRGGRLIGRGWGGGSGNAEQVL